MPPYRFVQLHLFGQKKKFFDVESLGLTYSLENEVVNDLNNINNIINITDDINSIFNRQLVTVITDNSGTVGINLNQGDI